MSFAVSYILIEFLINYHMFRKILSYHEPHTGPQIGYAVQQISKELDTVWSLFSGTS